LYHLENSQLRVCGKWLRQERNRVTLSGLRLILLQHILPTTEELVRLLRQAGGEIFSIFAKPFSIESAVFDRMRASGLTIIQKSYQELENTPFLDEHLQSAIGASRADGKKIVILEVGGYFAEPLSRLPAGDARYVSGVVEDTTFGHNRYLALAGQIPVPIVSVARSELKEIEARFVGQDAVIAMDYVLRELGVAVTGRRALVVGFGMIGKNVARALYENHLDVSVYDTRDYRRLRAFCAGFNVGHKIELLNGADIIFSATGNKAITTEEIELCKNNVILASVGSKDTEFDIRGLEELAISCDKIGLHIVKYTLPSSKNVMVVKGGAAVNFILPSLPVEILDLVFAEIVMASIRLIKTPELFSLGKVNAVPDRDLSNISQEWLKYVNH
jgi:adenosylhomocysteinase